MLKAPEKPRDALELLTGLGSEAGLDALLDRVDWAGVNPLQVYQGIFGRLPEAAQFAVVGPEYSARDHAREALVSPEFQSEIRERVLAALPEKKRLIFIHIPKCAGTDLIASLGLTYPRLYEDLSMPHWISGENFFAYLRTFMNRVGRSDSIFVHGHVPLTWYLERNMIRFGDQIFTVVRSPLDIMISQVNYIFKRFFEAPRCQEPDTRIWADMLGIAEFDRAMPEREIVALGLRALRDQRIVVPNFLCTYLGSGTMESALDAAARCNIEITDVDNYSEWLRQRWGASTSYANKSASILQLKHLSRSDLDYLKDITQEDERLYDAIMIEMNRSGQKSIFGADLYRSAAWKTQQA